MMGLTTKGFHFYEGETKWLAKGITYGPFCPDAEGHCYPGPERLRRDFAAIAATGANVVRLYTVPTTALAAIAAEHGLRLVVDVSWPKHLDVYTRRDLQDVCFAMVDDALAALRSVPNMMGVLLGNEIPADLVRWAGADTVSDLLRRMYRRAKAIAPNILVGFSNYPSTEYLPLSFFDFVGFNVYLNDNEDMRSYIIRLRHLYPDQPLILSETGADTQGGSEESQAELLRHSLETAFEVGMAGAFVFSWTDEWHTGGYNISDWSFGITTENRTPKAAYSVVSEIYNSAPQTIAFDRSPKVSVVIATYNGGETLRECLESLQKLRYSNFEIIVVDDGSTDNTQELLRRFPEAIVVRQTNLGLSAARNTGIKTSTGEIIAFTDSDCVVDPDWLYHIVAAMQRKCFAGVGGPNMTPLEDSPVHRAVGAAPGHATHVMLDEEVAEHVPGCNMAFWKDVLLSVDGFDPHFRTAGDDVDIIWRMQDRSFSIGFAAGAFVWHHRRTSIMEYIRQQRGYGYAEALLLHKHPHKFNDRGQSLWRGVIYTGRDQLRLFHSANINYGVFCSNGYQCIYHRQESVFSHLFTSLEWWIVSIGMLLVGYFTPVALIAGIAAVAASVTMTGLKASRKTQRMRDFTRSQFPVVWLLWILQPIIREGSRYWAHFRGHGPSSSFGTALKDLDTLSGSAFKNARILEYWGEKVPDRIQFLRALAGEMARRKWIFFPNSGWEPWDITVIASWWFKTRMTTGEEDHGENQHVLKIRFETVPSSLFFVLSAAAVLLSGMMLLHDTVIARVMMTFFIVLFWVFYRKALKARHIVQRLADNIATSSGYTMIKPIPTIARESAEEIFAVSGTDPV